MFIGEWIWKCVPILLTCKIHLMNDCNMSIKCVLDNTNCSVKNVSFYLT